MKTIGFKVDNETYILYRGLPPEKKDKLKQYVKEAIQKLVYGKPLETMCKETEELERLKKKLEIMKEEIDLLKKENTILKRKIKLTPEIEKIIEEYDRLKTYVQDLEEENNLLSQQLEKIEDELINEIFNTIYIPFKHLKTALTNTLTLLFRTKPEIYAKIKEKIKVQGKLGRGVYGSISLDSYLQDRKLTIEIREYDIHHVDKTLPKIKYIKIQLSDTDLNVITKLKKYYEKDNIKELKDIYYAATPVFIFALTPKITPLLYSVLKRLEETDEFYVDISHWLRELR